MKKTTHHKQDFQCMRKSDNQPIYRVINAYAFYSPKKSESELPLACFLQKEKTLFLHARFMRSLERNQS